MQFGAFGVQSEGKLDPVWVSYGGRTVTLPSPFFDGESSVNGLELWAWPSGLCGRTAGPKMVRLWLPT